MNLVYSAAALADAFEILAWWLDNRDSEDLFENELRAAGARVLRGPHQPKVFTRVDGIEIRRVLLKRTHHHLYYQCWEGTVYVLRVWGAPKRGAPDLRPVQPPAV